MNDKFLELKDFNGLPIDASGYKVDIKDIAFFLLKNPAWIRYLISWHNTFSIKNSLDLGIPWYNYGAINWVTKYINKKMNVFEYGSGGSTLFYSKQAAELVSVEHDKLWYDMVSKFVENEKNTTVILVEPEQIEENKECKYRSHTFAQYRDFSFENYVRTIDKYPDGYFDLISIDGRCRPMCLEHSIKKVKQGGWIIFDNSERLHYHLAINQYNFSKKINFYGFGPSLNTFWYTTIMKV